LAKFVPSEDFLVVMVSLVLSSSSKSNGFKSYLTRD
jgi:hypothetical protein